MSYLDSTIKIHANYQDSSHPFDIATRFEPPLKRFLHVTQDEERYLCIKYLRFDTETFKLMFYVQKYIVMALPSDI